MNEEQIIKTLKAFSNIKPKEGFISRSRPLILAVSQKPRISGFRWLFGGLKAAPALMAVAIFMFLVLGAFTYYNRARENSLVDLDSEALLAEAGDLNFDIHLKEAKYFDESIKEVAAVLEKVGREKSGALQQLNNQELNKRVDDLINTIIL